METREERWQRLGNQVAAKLNQYLDDPTFPIDPKFHKKNVETDYLLIRPLSARIGYAVKTIYNLVSQGRLKEGVHYFKPTKRKLLFYWPAIEQWIREGQDGRKD